MLAIVNSGQETIQEISNLDMTFYKMFMSPITTLEQRKRDQQKDLLAGNLFCNPDFDMPNEGYLSLLETIALKPKKKHLKKVI